jgi:molecular chaperone DnaK
MTPGESKQVAVGIDLGTTTSALAVMRSSGELTAVPIDNNQVLMPSVLAIDDAIHFGQDAMNRGLENAEGMVESFKREMGDAHYHRKIRDQWVPPEVLNGFLLKEIRERAEKLLGTFQDAVITVPAYFDERRRKATFEAGRLAGLNVIDIINEPVAAALSDIHFRRSTAGAADEALDRDARIMVYDLGGGTFDVSILQIEGREIRTLATDGDVQLGGRDFDEKLADEIAGQFNARYGIDPRADIAGMQRLWMIAQDAKHRLSDQSSTTVVCNFNGMRLATTIARKQFEDLIEVFVERTLLTSCDALEQAGLNWSDINRIVLVGGSSRIPLVMERLSQLTGKRPAFSNSPDQAVALGAAYHAATSTSNSPDCLRVVNVNAHSLSVAGFNPATNEPVARVLIPRNSRLPASKQCSFITRRPNQKEVEIRVVEGESENPEYCSPVGKFVVPLSPNLPERTNIEVTCRYDSNGTISISAVVPLTREGGHVEITREGLTNLEPLETWHQRLTKGVAAVRKLPESPLPNLPPVATVTNNDVPQAVKRLDYLHHDLGRLCSDAVVPVAVLPAQRQLQNAVRELLAIDYLVGRLKHHLELESDKLSRSRMQASLAALKMQFDQTSRYLIHSRIVLGRECFLVGHLPDEMKLYAEEIQRLTQSVS